MFLVNGSILNKLSLDFNGNIYELFAPDSIIVFHAIIMCTNVIWRINTQIQCYQGQYCDVAAAAHNFLVKYLTNFEIISLQKHFDVN